MAKLTRGAAVLAVMAGALACESGQEPDLPPALALDGPAAAAAAASVDVAVTASDDRGLEGLRIDWGDGPVDSLALGGTSATAELEHVYATVGSYEVRATLFATGGQTATASLPIEVGAAEVVITPEGDTLNAVGFTTTLVARGYDALGVELPDFEPHWTSLDNGQASVGPGGVVTAKAAGEARIRAASGPAADTVTVLVRQVPRAVVITAPDTMGVRTWATASAVLNDSNDVRIFGAEITWSSGTPGVATVDTAGELTGVGEGSAAIIATAGAHADTATVEVALTILVSRPLTAGGQPNLFTITRHGTAGRYITEDQYYDVDADWSPDRRRIAFRSGRTEGADVIVLMDEDGGNVVELRTGLDRVAGMAWSPDGTRIAFEGYAEWEGTADLYLINIDGTGQTRITADTASEESPAWSPDGSRIAFVQAANIEADIVVMDPDGSNRVNLTGSLPALEFSPRWSPDGSEIAFALFSLDGSGSSSIHRMDADGGNIREIGPYSTLDLDWSPDGNFIAFSDGDIHLLPVDGGDLVRVTNNALSEYHVRWR